MSNRLNLLVLSLTGSLQKEEGRKEENPNSKKNCFSSLPKSFFISCYLGFRPWHVTNQRSSRICWELCMYWKGYEDGICFFSFLFLLFSSFFFLFWLAESYKCMMIPRLSFTALLIGFSFNHCVSLLLVSLSFMAVNAFKISSFFQITQISDLQP